MGIFLRILKVSVLMSSCGKSWYSRNLRIFASLPTSPDLIKCHRKAIASQLEGSLSLLYRRLTSPRVNTISWIYHLCFLSYRVIQSNQNNSLTLEQQRIAAQMALEVTRKEHVRFVFISFVRSTTQQNTRENMDVLLERRSEERNAKSSSVPF